MSSTTTVPAALGTATYTTSIAATPAQVRAAQALRHSVFADELGATVQGGAGLDVDEFDDRCDHLIIEHTPTKEVVGTYRLLPPGRGEHLYSESEFDLSALAPLRASLLEAGRSCVHPDHRTGAVITLMWSALARYALLSGHEYLAGCASVPLADGGIVASATRQFTETRHSSPPDLRVHPHRPWVPAIPEQRKVNQSMLPPLLRGYLRLGAWVCGPPAHDPEFGVADFFVLLRLDRMDDRYLRHFLGSRR
ncbi:Putative hemolysin [Amycolatopsis marina]|uniref:Hemolysin n=1 Tax=Amycolatopsis marina TaxID=490629 RepID=A0A1I0XI90_9PSEU|nr:GNAT family N-acyltransferase [Amycolatopsis marina]SFA99948.1 Putative hemolysin [Amycolatopsis marina]